MTKIPIPFIGGTEGPRSQPPDKEVLQGPYAPGLDAEEEAVTASAGDAGQESLGQTELAEPEPGAPVRIEVVDLDESPADVTDPTEPEPGLASGFEAPAVAAASAPPVPEGEATGDTSLDLPDFLIGPDAVPVEEEDSEVITDTEEPESEDTLAGMVRLETADRLERTADELLRGERGDWIRTLIADLGTRGPEIAVPRAFAAGYLAARGKKEEKS